MQVHLKNINLLIVKIPCLIMSILMLCALVLIANSQYTELTSNFDNQCKQYDASINLLLAKYNSQASLITKKTQIIDNLKIENHPVIHKLLVTITSSDHEEIRSAYIVNKSNEYFSRTPLLGDHVPIVFDDVEKRSQTTLFYDEHKKEPAGIFSLVYPLYDSEKNLAGGLVILVRPDKLLANIPYSPENPPLITIKSSEYSYDFSGNKNLPFLYTMENRITVPGNNVTITLRASILPVILTIIQMLLLFLLILAVFYMVLKFFAYCVNQSIEQPLKEMQETIQSYTSSVTQTKKPGSDNNDK